VDDGLETMPGEQAEYRGLVAKVHAIALDGFAEDPLQAQQHTRRTVGEVVGDDQAMPALGKRNAGVAADIAGTAADEDACWMSVHHLPCRPAAGRSLISLTTRMGDAGVHLHRKDFSGDDLLPCPAPGWPRARWFGVSIQT